MIGRAIRSGAWALLKRTEFGRWLTMPLPTQEDIDALVAEYENGITILESCAQSVTHLTDKSQPSR